MLDAVRAETRTRWDRRLSPDRQGAELTGFARTEPTSPRRVAASTSRSTPTPSARCSSIARSCMRSGTGSTTSSRSNSPPSTPTETGSSCRTATGNDHKRDARRSRTATPTRPAQLSWRAEQFRSIAATIQHECSTLVSDPATLHSPNRCKRCLLSPALRRCCVRRSARLPQQSREQRSADPSGPTGAWGTSRGDWGTAIGLARYPSSPQRLDHRGGHQWCCC